MAHGHVVAQRIWEVRQNGVRYCHCGTLRDAIRVAEMNPLRSVHKLPSASIEAETVDVSAVSLGHDKELKPQLVLPESDLQELEL